MKSPAESLLVTLVQTDLAWEDPKANLDMFESRISKVKDKMEVVVLPEMFSTGFSMNAAAVAEEMDGPSVQWMRKLANARKIILTGSLIIREHDRFYNRMIWMQPNGALYYYDKRHLFGYAGEDGTFSPGAKRLIVSVKGWKINLQVCYDLRFPVWARQQPPSLKLRRPKDEELHLPTQASKDEQDDTRPPSLKLRRPEDEELHLPTQASKDEQDDTGLPLPEYDVLIYSANWPERRSHAWKTLLQARAIENQCYVVGVNRIGNDGNGIHYAGDSMVVDPLGGILCTPGQRDDVCTYALTLNALSQTRDKLPFLKDADRFLMDNARPPKQSEGVDD